MKKSIKGADGFSLIELLVAALIFTVVAGGIFSVLMGSQMRYQSDSGLTTVFQQANLAMDQITRDIHSAGYPAASSFSSGTSSDYYALPFAWSPGYPAAPLCMTGSSGTCAIPGEYDLILEADQGNGNGVQWIRYSLVGTTLKRIVAPKSGSDPITPTDPTTAPPYLENVINGATPVFSYSPDPSVPLGQAYSPLNIREVNVCLIVQSARPDPQTGQLRKITVTGQAVRFNPNQ